MKKYLLIGLVSLSLFSCNKEELSKLKAENHQLRMLSEESDSTINTFMGHFSEIEQNLAEIREREANISITSESKGLSQSEMKNRIMDDISAINDLMVENKQKIQELSEKLENTSNNNSQLNRMLASLKKQMKVQLEVKDKEIASLKNNLEELNFSYKELNTNYTELTKNYEEQKEQLATWEQTIDEQTETIAQQTASLNTGYYVVGDKGVLANKNVIVKKGGFLGMGKTSTLNTKLDETAFNKINITEVTTIPVNSKKVEFVTTHPKESYELEVKDKLVQEIKILNPDLFWNSSKYLVVKVD
ncbi:hypothetical protein AAG747_13870 [Rapidithrix thailandica]|uniref:Chromosome partition protein Smc n=1 Tax=Rapidithrix thailandica TaxID=413964 RepID=A0AAW9SE89_9BACT